MKRVAIQGFVGSFHDIAAHQYFDGEQLQLVCCATFEEVFEHLAKDPTMIGMTAIENTIAGSLPAEWSAAGTGWEKSCLRDPKWRIVKTAKYGGIRRGRF